MRRPCIGAFCCCPQATATAQPQPCPPSLPCHAVNRQGSWLAAADDGGEVALIGLQQPRGPGGRPAYKTLRRGHSNIASTVAFRPHRSVEP